MRTLLVLTLGVMVSNAVADEHSDLVLALAAHYHSGKGIDAEALVARLSAPEAAEREAASKTVWFLLERTLADERAEQPTWKSRESDLAPPQRLRRKLGECITRRRPPGVLPFLRWFLDRETQGEAQIGALRALAGVDGDESTSLLRELVHRPHPNGVVLAEALAALFARGLMLELDVLAPLHHNPRPKVRAAAAAAARLAGLAVPAVTPEGMLDALGPLLDRCAALVELPTPSAPFIELSVTTRIAGLEHVTVSGWLVRETDDAFVVMTTGARTETYEKTRAQRVEHTIEDAVKRWSTWREDWNRAPRSERLPNLDELMLGLVLRRDGRNDLSARILLPALDTLWRDEGLVTAARVQFGEVLGCRMLVAFVGDRDYPRALELARRVAEHHAGCTLHAAAVRLARELALRGDDFHALDLPTPEAWKAKQAELSRNEQIDFLSARLRLVNVFQWSIPGNVDPDGPMYGEPSGMSSNAVWRGDGGRTDVINPYAELENLKLEARDVARLASKLEESWAIPSVSFFLDTHLSGRSRHTLWNTDVLLVRLINGIAQDVLIDWAWNGESRKATIARAIEWSKSHAAATEVELCLAVMRRERARGGSFNTVQGQVWRLVELGATQAVPDILSFLDAPPTEWEVPQVVRAAARLDLKATVPAARRLLDAAPPGVRREAALVLLEAGDPSDRDRSLTALRGWIAAVTASRHDYPPAEPASGPNQYRRTYAPSLDAQVFMPVVDELLADGSTSSRAAVRALIAEDVRPHVRVLAALVAARDERERDGALAAISTALKSVGQDDLDSQVYGAVSKLIETSDLPDLPDVLRHLVRLELAANMHLSARRVLCRRLLALGDAEPYRSYVRALRMPGIQLWNCSYGEPVAIVFARDLVELSAGTPEVQAIVNAEPDDPARWVAPLDAWLVRRIAEMEAARK